MSLNQTFTLAVDEDNDGGTTAAVDVAYSEYDSYQNRTDYITDAHTVELRDKCGFYRTFPKVSGNFRGTAKSAVKFTKDYSVPGVDATTTLVVPGIIDVNFSFPVGMTSEQKLALRMRAAALLTNDSLMQPLTDQLMI